MSADELIQYLSWVIYLAIFASALLQAIRRPLRAQIDIALLFSVTTVIIVLASATRLKLLPPSAELNIVSGGLLLALPYMLLRLIDDFAAVPRWLPRGAGGLLVLFTAATAFFTYSPPPPGWLVAFELAYLIGLLAYSVVAFWRASRQASGVTRRRMRAAALGSIALCALFVIIGLRAAMPGLAGLWQPLSDLAGLASAVSYFMGFSPPALVRRAWQEPELRAFLARAARLPRLPDTQAILRAMEQGAANALGAPRASIGLWDPANQTLDFFLDGETERFRPDPVTFTGQAFLQQHPTYTDNLQRDNPAAAETTRKRGATALLAAPITAGEERLGVLTVYAPRAPIFAEEDLALVELLADQAAVILESRALIDEAARVRAREEVTRLKEDFLSAAAHDLKTPLTTLVAQAQLLERRAQRAPEAPADLTSIRRIVREAERLRTLVLELLDAARAEQGRLVGQREEMDLVALAQATAARYSTEHHRCEVEAPPALTGVYDPHRIEQLVQNLVENGVKYSPDGGPVHIRLWRENGWNHLSVRDSGIGIPPDDLPKVFDRFHRGSNVDDRHFAGMGLGLFICRGIVEQHGGRISVESAPANGSTFHVTLPAPAPAANAAQNGGEAQHA